MELCGKLAIAQAILEAENKSKLKIDNVNLDKFERFSPQHVQDTWYERFFMLLTESVRRGGLTNLFDNVSFVIFNYDRCVEHFLYYSLQNYYRLTEQEAAQLLERLTITHPYGAVGRLPWQIDKAGVPFGVHQNDMRLLEIAGQIKTFTERVEDEAARDAIRTQVKDADTVVFLGFAFHPLNMELITPESSSVARRAFATAVGISGSDIDVVRKDIAELLRNGPEKPNIDLRIANTFSCMALFDEYQRTLSRR